MPSSDPLFILHKPRREPYRRWNCTAGLYRAHRLGANALDVDMSMTRDGVLVANHWPRAMLRDGFRDPLRKVPRRKRVQDLAWRIVCRLRSRDGYKIQSVGLLGSVSADLSGFTLCLEAKPDLRLTRAGAWSDDLAYLASLRCRIIVMATPGNGIGIDTLAAAKEAGLTTMLLARGRVPAEWARHLDYVKGSARACRDVPDVKRVGTGPRDATVHGCRVSVRNITRARRAVRQARAAQ